MLEEKVDIYRAMCNKHGKGKVWSAKADELCNMIEEFVVGKVEMSCHLAGKPDAEGENHVIGWHWKELAEHILSAMK